MWGEKSLYGKKFMGIVRSAFVVDEKGKLKGVFYKVSPKDTVPKRRPRSKASRRQYHAPTAWKPPSTWSISPVVAGKRSESSATHAAATGAASFTSQPSGARVGPHRFELVEPRDALGRDGAERTRGDQVDADVVGAEITREVTRGRFERGLGHTHPVVHRPRVRAVVEIEADDRAAARHERPARDRERLQ